ncbi:MAG TPA: tetratricopeptide repeat protein [Candidatus Paceibacterota bacterium]|nr:tetratricopeptide repeat protein [Candidatus Paceibacterota bacterium]
MTPTASSKLDRIAFYALQATLFLAPVFFIPSMSVPLQTGKSAVLLIGITIAVAVWLIARLKDGAFSWPKTWLYAGAGILGLVYAVSALASANQAASLSGQGFELGTLAFFLPSLVLFMLIPIVTKTEKQVFYSYVTLFIAFLVAGLFHVIRFAGGAGTLSFGLFTDVTANFIGKWNDVGIFFGLGAILSLITLERTPLSRLLKTIVYIVFVLSLVMLVVVNFSPVWIALAVLSLVFFIYELSYGKRSDGATRGNLGTRIPYHTLITLVVAAIFLFFGGRMSSLIANTLGTSQVEVRPSWSATLDITKAALKDNPILGAGPNRFATEWLMNKPAGINSTLFWNTDFAYGIGFIPSLATTTGLLGILAALFFVGTFAWTAVRALLKEGSSPFSRYLVLSSLFASAYLWIFAAIYVPSNAIWILTLGVSGLFVASLREDKALGTRHISIVNRPAASFVSVLVSVIALIGAVSFGYFVAVKTVANIYYQKGVVALNATSDLDKGEADVLNAISLSPTPLYYQSLSEIYLARLNNLFNDTKITQTDAQTKFQSLIGTAIQAAQAAVAADPTDYKNYMTLGRVFESVVPLNIEGAYDSAKKAYDQALALNPQSPEIRLVMARLEVAKKDNEAAKADIAEALKLKSDYADAIYLLSQIQISENDVDEAIKSVSAVATLSPSDPGIFFQLGLLYYSKKDYPNSVLALERAVSLNSQYANAKYFLGLAYYLTGSKDKSLSEFQELSVSNPDSQEVKDALAALAAGKSPVPAPSSAVNKPLPVKEQ